MNKSTRVFFFFPHRWSQAFVCRSVSLRHGTFFKPTVRPILWLFDEDNHSPFFEQLQITFAVLADLFSRSVLLCPAVRVFFARPWLTIILY